MKGEHALRVRLPLPPLGLRMARSSTGTASWEYEEDAELRIAHSRRGSYSGFQASARSGSEEGRGRCSTVVEVGRGRINWAAETRGALDAGGLPAGRGKAAGAAAPSPGGGPNC